MKDTKKLFKNILRALPAIPYIAPRRRPVAPFIFGALGAAIVGGIAAIMLFSPRTRYRALDAAKEGFGKVRGQIDHLNLREKVGRGGASTRIPQHPYESGAGNDATSTTYSSAGT